MTPTTPRQARALSALATRRASSGGPAMSADLWTDGDAAEATLMRSKQWRTYRENHPR